MLYVSLLGGLKYYNDISENHTFLKIISNILDLTCNQRLKTRLWLGKSGFQSILMPKSVHFVFLSCDTKMPRSRVILFSLHWAAFKVLPHLFLLCSVWPELYSTVSWWFSCWPTHLVKVNVTTKTYWASTEKSSSLSCRIWYDDQTDRKIRISMFVYIQQPFTYSWH